MVLKIEKNAAEGKMVGIFQKNIFIYSVVAVTFDEKFVFVL